MGKRIIFRRRLFARRYKSTGLRIVGLLLSVCPFFRGIFETVMPPSRKLSGEIGMGVGDLQVVDDLRASIGFDGENCQLSQLGGAN